MRTYLKKFDDHSDYETFTGSTDFILPNVSVCVNEDEVHFRPYIYHSCLRFTSEQNNSSIHIKFIINTSVTGASNTIKYSIDNGQNWNSYTFRYQSINNSRYYYGPTINLNAGETIMFKGANNYLSTTINYYKFIMTGKIKAKGDITSLLNEIGGDMTIPNYVFYGLFEECTSLTEPPSLPVTKLTSSCYRNMFYGCTSLKTAPELPATTLADYCYSEMFNGCTSLEIAPELPSTTLAYSCYMSMFKGCTSLTTAPELPATNMYDSCYWSMFENCTSLTSAPYLPSLNVQRASYQYMFKNCNNLNYVKAMFLTIGDYSLNDWLYGVSEIGTFVKNAEATWDITGNSGIPNGWTVQTTNE